MEALEGAKFSRYNTMRLRNLNIYVIQAGTPNVNFSDCENFLLYDILIGGSFSFNPLKTNLSAQLTYS